jgi:ATP-dependent DNA ligase
MKLYSRPGNDLTYRFPLIVEAIAKLRSRSCIIDGEAVACARAEQGSRRGQAGLGRRC